VLLPLGTPEAAAVAAVGALLAAACSEEGRDAMGAAAVAQLLGVEQRAVWSQEAPAAATVAAARLPSCFTKPYEMWCSVVCDVNVGEHNGCCILRKQLAAR
jgi:hypothetical protein